MIFGIKKGNLALSQKIAAIDLLSTRVMIADVDLNITYMNPAVAAFLSEAEAELKSELPRFSVATLIGSNIDIFHKNPAHQRKMLAALDKPHNATIKVGSRLFDLKVSPLTERGQKIGFVVEWADAKERLLNLDYAGQLTAIGKSQSVIEFELDGTIITANENFLHALGYTLDEIRGKNHSMLVDPIYRESRDYRDFWAALNRGEYQAAEFKRIGKNGKEIWIQASYNPILDRHGKPAKVVKFATDVTAVKLMNSEFAGQLEAIGKSQGVIEFELDGTIRTANENFLRTIGYSLEEIRGKSHSMLVEASYRGSAEYRDFWAALNRGEYQAAEFKRVAKGGREIWIQASYNPILDLNGRPFKVVKYATDVTAQVIRRMKSELVSSMMDTIASGAEELNSSVREISSSMQKSREAADDAFDRAVEADHTTGRLSSVAQSMNGILGLINNITNQINLLALNATIEAARAGDAGRGFAVVATEVKNLAAQARSATDEIGAEINGMNEVSEEVVASLQRIRQSIDNVRSYVTSTASAVEEQSAVTSDMTSNMQRAAAEASSIG